MSKVNSSEIPQNLKFIYIYNKIISFYLIFLTILILIGSAFLGVGIGGLLLLVPFVIIYLLWYFFMIWGLRFRKKYNYWVNIIVHIIIVIINISSIFSPSNNKIFGINASFITTTGILIMIFNILLSLLFISGSGYSIYLLFKKKVKDLF